MTVHYNEKGKFFTDYVTKDTVRVTIQTTSHRVHGNIYVKPEVRLTDELNQSPLFIAVTEAEVHDNQGKCLYKTDFLTVNSEHVIWVLPDRECKEASDES